MNLELTKNELRYLLDMVYIGNWILNSTRENDIFINYQLLQEKIFALAAQNGMPELAVGFMGHTLPSKAYEDGGIHDAIAEYEDSVFFDILAEELSRRDMNRLGISAEDYTELGTRIDCYMSEFEQNGLERLNLEP